MMKTAASTKGLLVDSIFAVLVAAAGADESPAGDHAWHVTTLAGSGPQDLDSIRACRIPGHSRQRTDGPADSARFAAPTRAQVINDTVYVMDGMNGCIRTASGRYNVT